MDKDESLLQEIWDSWKPYHESQNGKWKSYLVTMDIDENGIVHLAQAANGQIYEMS